MRFWFATARRYAPPIFGSLRSPHIMANSNSTEDQELKYLVKSKLIDFYTPYLAKAENKEQAINVIEDNLDVASLLINKSLLEAGVT